MSDLLKAAIGSAVIIAAGLYFGATESAPRYTIAASANGAIAWSMDQKTGRFTYCDFSQGCHLVPTSSN